MSDIMVWEKQDVASDLVLVHWELQRRILAQL